MFGNQLRFASIIFVDRRIIKLGIGSRFLHATYIIAVDRDCKFSRVLGFVILDDRGHHDRPMGGEARLGKSRWARHQIRPSSERGHEPHKDRASVSFSATSPESIKLSEAVVSPDRRNSLGYASGLCRCGTSHPRIFDQLRGSSRTIATEFDWIMIDKHN